MRFANIKIIEGIGASQYGIGMLSAWLTELVFCDEQAVIPVASYNPKYRITLSLPSVIGHTGVLQVFEPAISHDERKALEHSAETLRKAVERVAPRLQRPTAA